MRLAEALAAVEAGIRPAGGVSERTGSIPSIGGENISPDGRMRYGGLRKIPLSFFSAMRCGKLAAGDVLINKDGAQTGKVAMYGGDFPAAAINEHVFLLRGQQGILDQRFLFHFLASPEAQRQISRVITGSAQPGLKSDFARHVELELPTVRNQQRIADVLDGVSNATRRTELVVEKLSRMKEGLLQDLLTRAIAADGTLWDYERSPDQFEDSSGRLLPAGWLLTTLREVATRITDGDHHTPSRAEHGVLLLSARNVINGHLDLSDVDYVPETEYRRMIKRCHPEPGDILISCSGTIGRVAEVPPGVRCVLVRSAALVKLDRAQINPRYAEWALQSHDVRRQILVGQRQAAQPNLFQSEISSLVIPLPPLGEQLKIAAVLDRLRDRLDSERRLAEKLRALKLGVARDLLTGRVSVEDFDPQLGRRVASEVPE